MLGKHRIAQTPRQANTHVGRRGDSSPSASPPSCASPPEGCSASETASPGWPSPAPLLGLASLPRCGSPPPSPAAASTTQRLARFGWADGAVCSSPSCWPPRLAGLPDADRPASMVSSVCIDITDRSHGRNVACACQHATAATQHPLTKLPTTHKETHGRLASLCAAPLLILLPAADRG